MLNENKEPVYISHDIFRTILKAFYTSIDNKDKDTFFQLNSFLYKRLTKSFETDNSKAFEQFSGLFSAYYEYALTKLSSSITYKDIYEVVSDRAVRGLKEKLGWGFRFQFRNQELSLEEKKRINQYSKILLNRFAEVINICLRSKDLAHLTFILNELHQASDSYNHHLTSLKHNISFKRKAIQTDEELKELSSMQDIYNTEAYLHNSVRLLFKVTLFWSFFLYDTDVLTEPELRQILKAFEVYRGYLEQDFLEDLELLRDFNVENEYVWGRWDYMERLSGVTYTPPSLHNWSTFGAIVYILYSKGSIYMEIEEKTPDQIRSFEYLADSIIGFLKSLSKNGHPKWSIIVAGGDQELFQDNIGQLSDRVNTLKTRTITAQDKLIANAVIDPEYVENFLDIMTKGWESGNDVRLVFDYFNKIKSFTEEQDLKDMWMFGSKNQVRLGFKRFLIKDDVLNATIYGVEKDGEIVANSEENIFLSSFLGIQAIETNNIFLGLDQALDKLVSKSFSPNIIFCGFNIWYSHFANLKSESFSFDWNDKQGFPFKNFGGVYKGLPIVHFRSDLINNLLIVADFNQAFSLHQRTKENAYKQVLRRSITQIFREDAERIINENPTVFWPDGEDYEDAIIKVMNSVLIDFYIVEKFILENPEAFSCILLET